MLRSNIYQSKENKKFGVDVDTADLLYLGMEGEGIC
jgi:hypothetical protein